MSGGTANAIGKTLLLLGWNVLSESLSSPMIATLPFVAKVEEIEAYVIPNRLRAANGTALSMITFR
jgi:hypothetical protein